MHLQLKTFLAIAIAVCSGPSVALAHIESTIFGPGGAIGALIPDASVIGTAADLVNFGEANLDGSTNVGETLFFQNGGFYVGGAGAAINNPLSDEGLQAFGGTPVANNRSYGVLGAGRSDITFNSDVIENGVPRSVIDLILQVRGTSADDAIGGTAPDTTLPNDTLLADADASLLVFTNLGAELSFAVPNDDFGQFRLNFRAVEGEFIERIALVNEGPANSAIVLGELTIVPEPMSVALLLTMSVGACLPRRR